MTQLQVEISGKTNGLLGSRRPTVELKPLHIQTDEVGHSNCNFKNCRSSTLGILSSCQKCTFMLENDKKLQSILTTVLFIFIDQVQER